MAVFVYHQSLDAVYDYEFRIRDLCESIKMGIQIRQRVSNVDFCQMFFATLMVLMGYV